VGPRVTAQLPSRGLPRQPRGRAPAAQCGLPRSPAPLRVVAQRARPPAPGPAPLSACRGPASAPSARAPAPAPRPWRPSGQRALRARDPDRAWSASARRRRCQPGPRVRSPLCIFPKTVLRSSLAHDASKTEPHGIFAQFLAHRRLPSSRPRPPPCHRRRRSRPACTGLALLETPLSPR
jgi:hypothetical protein